MIDMTINAKANLLVVDDDPLLRSLLSRWLNDEGYSVNHASNAQEAWALLEQQQFDLITLDMRMPGMSGLQLLKQIKEKLPDVAVLMLTGEGDTTAAVETLTSGAYGYLQKPAEREELVVQVANGLKYRQMIIERRLYTESLAEKVHEQTATIVAAHEETVLRLIRASLYRDEETGAHIKRVGEFSRLLARKVGWSDESAELIRQAAPLHDVGKIGIPDAVLQKPGKLSDDEMSVMRTHAMIGAGMLSGSKFPMLQMAEEIAMNHHEQWNGSGYPQGLSGHAIPESARIVAIVDVYDALSHDRVYRPALLEQDVLAILRTGRGQHFDPMLLDAFFEILPEIRSLREAIVDHSENDKPMELECSSNEV